MTKHNMTIFYTIASAMLMSSNVSATNNIQRLPGVTVQADSSVSKKASKFPSEGKLLGIKKKTIILSAVGIAAILAVVYIAKNSNAKNSNKDDKKVEKAYAASLKLMEGSQNKQDGIKKMFDEAKYKVVGDDALRTLSDDTFKTSVRQLIDTLEKGEHFVRRI